MDEETLRRAPGAMLRPAEVALASPAEGWSPFVSDGTRKPPRLEGPANIAVCVRRVRRMRLLACLLCVQGG